MESRTSRSYKSVGIAAIGAGAISVASVMAPPADVEVPEHQPTNTASSTREMVELLAAVQQRTTPTADTSPVPARDTSAPKLLALPPIPLLDAMAPPVPTPAPTLPAPGAGARETAISGSDAPTPEMLTLPANPLLGGLADAIDNTYNAVETPIRALVEAVEEGLTQLGVPNFLAAQGTILYTFGEAVVKSVLFNGTDWLRGEGSFFSNVEDLGNDLLAAGLWLTIDELNAFDLLPPTPVDLPRPPMNQSVETGFTTSPTADEEDTVDEGARSLADEAASTDSSVTETVTEVDVSGDLDPGDTANGTAEPTETDTASTDDISAQNIDEATDDKRSGDTGGDNDASSHGDTGGDNDASSHGDSDPDQDADKGEKRDKRDGKGRSAQADTDRSDSDKDSD
ncbi:hypothetical protein [Mycolicibacterium hippocampi]|uniref:hypothetical protein n=1 Tax=Mycolicibacterium hippocampi TaxID=659824 RepID=UPI0013D48F4D|nr:hypothetical protein [Mycolicibacterium hippocampi]